jgi:DAACS family dicarboxylate/amino acid:cation (Na+ or H+) symporter
MADGARYAGIRGIKFPLHLRIILGLALGLVVGPLLGKSALPLGELGKLVIQLIKAFATPLLFFAIVAAIVKTEIRGRAAVKLLCWAALNASLALAIGLAISNIVQPGQHLSAIAGVNPAAAAAYANKKIDLLATLNGYVPTSLVAPFVDNVVLTLILIAALLGFALRRVRREQEEEGKSAFRVIEDAVDTLLRVLEVLLGWVIQLIPFAVFGVVAKAVGEHGYAPLKGLAVYVAVGLGGLAIHVAITYQVWLTTVARMPLRKFWREAREPIAYAAGANSSLATLPVTLRALDRLGVSRSSSALGACVGTNFNNDGIILYEGMAVLFVAQASGIHLTFAQQLLAAAACMIAAMGVAGVPEAGFVSLALVLNTIGLPLEILPLLLTVDWIIARGRSVTNVLSDMLLSILIDSNNQRASSDTLR